MKKKYRTYKETGTYYFEILIKNTALMKSNSGLTGLVNIKTNEIVGSFADFHTTYDKNNFFYYQELNWNNYSADRFLRIYDALNEKLIADLFLLVRKVNDFDFMILQNPETQKYHIFDRLSYKDGTNSFSNEYDDAQMLDDKTIAVSLNGKVGIYKMHEGITEPIIYDNIEKKRYVIVFTRGNKKFFAGYKKLNYEAEEIISPDFDEITLDSKHSTLLYCTQNMETYIYLIERYDCNHIFTVSGAKVIKCLDIYKESPYDDKADYYFLTQKNDLCALSFGHYDGHNQSKCDLLTKYEYDDIKKVSSKEFYLYKNGKVGLFKKDNNKKYFIEALYDEIAKNYCYYLLYNNGTCDVITLDKKNWPLIRKCNILTVNYYDVHYGKNNYEGLLVPTNDGNNINYDNYDKITYLGGDFYEFEKNGKKGIFYNDEFLIDLKYKSISLQGDDSFDTLKYSDTVYFALELENGNFELAKLTDFKRSYKNRTLTYLNNVYKKIKLFEDIMVLWDENKSYVYNYNEKLLKIFDKDMQISSVKLPRKDMKNGNFYLINDEYYFCINGKFEKALIEEYDCYITTYESDYGIVVVNTPNKSRHDEICAQIEKDSDEVFDAKLISMYEDNKDIQEKYPCLIRKKG